MERGENRDRLQDYYNEFAYIRQPKLFIILEMIANDKDTNEEVDLPYVRFRFR